VLNKEEMRQEKRQRRQDHLERIPIEGKFGQGKNRHGLEKIRAKLAETSEAWIRAIFLVMNLRVLLKLLFSQRLTSHVPIFVSFQALIWQVFPGH
jgi:transposase, IS5 family